MAETVHLYFKSVGGERHELKLSSVPIVNGVPTAAIGNAFAGLAPGTTALLQFEIQDLRSSSKQQLQSAMASGTPVPLGLCNNECFLTPGIMRPVKVEDLMVVGSRGRLHLKLE